jgi:hypothetical protein
LAITATATESLSSTYVRTLTLRTEKALPRPVWTKQGVAQLHYIAVETNLFRNILIRRHFLCLKSEQPYFFADG